MSAFVRGLLIGASVIVGAFAAMGLLGVEGDWTLVGSGIAGLLAGMFTGRVQLRRREHRRRRRRAPR